jgi:hypothetical protein
MKRMTLDEWRAKDADYRGIRFDCGTPSVLSLDPKTGATISEPVELVDAEITYHYRRHASGARRWEVVAVIWRDDTPEHIQVTGETVSEQIASSRVARYNGAPSEWADVDA